MDTTTRGGAWKRMKWVVIGYVALAIGATWLIARGDADAAMPVTVGWLYLPIPLAIAAISLATRWAPVKFGEYASRDGEEKASFWLVVGFQAVLAVGLVLFALGVF